MAERRFNLAAYLRTPEDVAAYLEAALQGDDNVHLRSSVRVAIGILAGMVPEPVNALVAHELRDVMILRGMPYRNAAAQFLGEHSGVILEALEGVRGG